MPRSQRSASQGGVLLMALVGTVLLTILLTNFIYMFRNANMAQKNIDARHEVTEVMNEITMFLKNPAACREYFLTKEFNPNPATLSSQHITNLSIWKPGFPASVLYRVGTMITPTLRLDKLELEDFISNGPNAWVATLTLSATPVGSTSAMQFNRKSPVALITAPVSPTIARISDCGGGGGAAAPAIALRCTTTGGSSCPVGQVMTSCQGTNSGPPTTPIWTHVQYNPATNRHSCICAVGASGGTCDRRYITCCTP